VGDGGWGIGDSAQSPIPNPQSPIPNPQKMLFVFIIFQLKKLIYNNKIFNIFSIL